MASTDLQALETQRDKILGRHQKELEGLDDQIKDTKRAQMDDIISQARDLGYHVTITSSKAKKLNPNRKPATCSSCREVDLPGTGHTARSHDKWMATQPPDTQAKFK